MAFDPNKVAFSQAELDAAANADALLELVIKRVSDGLGYEDLVAVPEIFARVNQLLAFVSAPVQEPGGPIAPGRADIARRLIALGVMLERDGEFIR